MKLPKKSDTQFIFSDLFETKDVSKLKVSMRSMTFTRKTELSPYIPKINPNHYFEYSDGFRKLFFYLATGKGLSPWVFGPQGCGKTSGVAQLAAWFKAPLRQTYVSDTTESEDLLFGYMPGQDGVLKIRHYALANAMKNGWWFIINEFDLLAPTQQKFLNQLFEEKVVELPTGERIVAHKDFRLIVTANTNGSGDFTGNSCNVGQSDASVSARFFFVSCDYLSPEREKEMLRNIGIDTLNTYGLSKDKCNPDTWGHMLNSLENIIIPTIVDYANEVRSSYRGMVSGGKGLPFTLSQRTTVEWTSQTVVDFLWETDPLNGVHNAIEKGLQHSFIEGVRTDFQSEAKNIFNELVGDSLKAVA